MSAEIPNLNLNMMFADQCEENEDMTMDQLAPNDSDGEGIINESLLTQPQGTQKRKRSQSAENSSDEETPKMAKDSSEISATPNSPEISITTTRTPIISNSQRPPKNERMKTKSLAIQLLREFGRPSTGPQVFSRALETRKIPNSQVFYFCMQKDVKRCGVKSVFFKQGTKFGLREWKDNESQDKEDVSCDENGSSSQAESDCENTSFGDPFSSNENSNQVTYLELAHKILEKGSQPLTSSKILSFGIEYGFFKENERNSAAFCSTLSRDVSEKGKDSLFVKCPGRTGFALRKLSIAMTDTRHLEESGDEEAPEQESENEKPQETLTITTPSTKTKLGTKKQRAIEILKELGQPSTATKVFQRARETNRLDKEKETNCQQFYQSMYSDIRKNGEKSAFFKSGADFGLREWQNESFLKKEESSFSYRESECESEKEKEKESEHIDEECKRDQEDTPSKQNLCDKVRQFALEILSQKGYPMTGPQIFRCANGKDLFPKTICAASIMCRFDYVPLRLCAASISARIGEDIRLKGERSLFVKCLRGYGLREWDADKIGALPQTAATSKSENATGHSTGPFDSQSPSMTEINDVNIEQWLEQIGMSQYLPDFKKHGFDHVFEALSLTEQDLEHTLGIVLLGHRRRIIMKLEQSKKK